MATLTLDFDCVTFLDYSQPTVIFGSSTDVYFGVVYVDSKAGLWRPVKRLVLPEWLASSDVNSAKITLWVVNAGESAAACHVKRMNSGGDSSYHIEAQETWDDRKTGTAWATATGGGDYVDAGHVAFNMWTSTGAQEITGLGDLVKDAIDNRSRVFDVLLRLDDEDPDSTNQAIFYSDDYTTDPTKQPKLVIDYTAAVTRRPFAQVT